MSESVVGTAFVRVLPDATAFARILTAEVNAAILQAQAATKPIIIPLSAASGAQGVAAANAAVASSATAAAGATTTLAAAQDLTAKEAARLAAAELSVARADAAATAATAAYTKALGANATAQTLASLAQKEALALQALNVAQLRQQAILNPTVAASKGIADLGNRADFARGSLIGLSRITPLTVFGLNAVGTAAIVAGTAFVASVASAAKFEQLLNTFQAVTQSTAADMERVSDTAIALGADLTLPSVSASDAAVALTELAKAGLTVQDSLDAAKGVLQLSAAANISAGDAAQIAATQLNAFQLAGDQATRVAELLADASIAAQGEITDFAAGFQQVAAVANQVGLTIEDTTGLLTQLGQAGLKGADGGTSLRTALLRLVPTTKEATQYQEALGIQIDRSKSIGEQIVPLIEQYRTQLSLLTEVQQQEVLTQIFGQDAIRAAAIIFGQEADALRDLTRQFAETNAIQDLSEAKAKGLAGAFGNLRSQGETLALQLGNIINVGLTPMVTELAEVVEEVNNAIAAFGRLADIPAVKVAVEVSFGLAAGAKEFIDGLPPAVKAATITALGPALQNIILSRAALRAVGNLGQETEETNTGRGGFSFIGGEIASAAVEKTGFASIAADKAARDAAKLAREQRIARARIAALKAEEQAGEVGIPIPKPLQQDLIDAQLSGSLKAELAVEEKIIDFYEKRLDRLKKGTDAYLKVSAQLLAATNARDAVEDEIESNAARAAAERESNRKKAAVEAERLSREAADAEKKRIAAQQLLQQTILDIQSQAFQNRLAAANLTETTVDNKKVLTAEQKRLIALRDAAKKIASDSSLSKQALADAKLKVLELNGQILGIQAQIKNLGKDSASGGDGFSLAELFAQAQSDFKQFGSNIASRGGILSPQDARGAFAGTVLAGRDASTDLQRSTLTQAEQQTKWLEGIYGALVNGRSTMMGGIPAQRGGKRGSLESIAEARYLGHHQVIG